MGLGRSRAKRGRSRAKSAGGEAGPSGQGGKAGSETRKCCLWLLGLLWHLGLQWLLGLLSHLGLLWLLGLMGPLGLLWLLGLLWQLGILWLLGIREGAQFGRGRMRGRCRAGQGGDARVQAGGEAVPFG